MNVGVIGAGWAGLSAALALRAAGLRPDIFEAAPAPGGRARPITLPGTGVMVDNGQHLLLGAYQHTLTLMRNLGIEPETVCHARPLCLRSVDGNLRLPIWPLPAPLHHLGPLMAGRGLSGWRGRVHLARLAVALRHSPGAAGGTVSTWLLSLGCPPGLLRDLWAPLCLAALNTPVEQADAALFARVLGESLIAGSAHCRLYIPRDKLDDLWPGPALRRLGGQKRTHRVRRLSIANGKWDIDGYLYDQVVLAVPEFIARKLLAPLPGGGTFLSSWTPLPQASIGTVTLRLARPWGSGLDMAMLWDDPTHQQWGQWLFDRSESASSETLRHLVHVVISDAQRYAGHTGPDVIRATIAQIRAQARTPLPEIISSHLVTEKRATFQAVPGLSRPGPGTPWKGLVLAGDWTDTGYPAVLEGAVVSGERAAHHLLQR